MTQLLIDSVKVMCAFFTVMGIVVLFTSLVWKWGNQWRRWWVWERLLH